MKGVKIAVAKPTKKPLPAHTPTPTPTIIGKFSVGGVTCEVIRVHGPSEDPISTKIMRERGIAAGADMGMPDGELLFRHRYKIPLVYWKHTFVFPAWTNEGAGMDDGCVRCMNTKGVDWWCLMRYPDCGDWDRSCLMVRFSKSHLA